MTYETPAKSARRVVFTAVVGLALGAWPLGAALAHPAAPAKPAPATPATSAAPAAPAKQPVPAKDAPKAANPVGTPTDQPEAKSGEEWWKNRAAELDKRIDEAAKSGGAGLLFIGDSITQGWENEGKAAWEKSYGKRHAVNLGIGGDRTQHVIWRLEHAPFANLAENPKLAVIMIGTNNMSANSPEEIARGVGKVISTLHARLPKTKVLLLAIFPRGEKADDRFRTKVTATNTLLKETALKPEMKSYVTYLDIGATFIGEGGVISKEIMPDFLHFSPKGYEMWAGAIEAEVKKGLGE
jgi:beta-glucosidase